MVESRSSDGEEQYKAQTKSTGEEREGRDIMVTGHCQDAVRERRHEVSAPAVSCNGDV